MEEKKKYEEIKSILEGIQKSIELYNNLNPQEKLAITLQDERKDVSDIFICVYNDKHVGLFKKLDWHSKSYGIENRYYEAGTIYIGVYSNYIGMKKTHESFYTIDSWQDAGIKRNVSGKTYVSNCTMQKCMSFDDMRLIMYSNRLIDSYEPGKATSKEINEVLEYAYSYYQLEQNIQRRRV